MGRSGGLALGFNPCTIHLNASWGGIGFIGMGIFSSDLGMDLKIVNIYGPCHHREAFWNHFLNLSIINPDNIILGGDLNFSIVYGEYWGINAQVDPLPDIMEQLLEMDHLMDIPMVKSQPTWCNHRIREAVLARCLDRFHIKDYMLSRLLHYRQRVGLRGISYHSPIFMEIFGPSQKPRDPFKFNSTCLENPSYIQLVIRYWLSHPPSSGRSMEEGFSANLIEINQLSIIWAKEKRD